MEFVTAHEVAHQWWYGLVGNDQVTHPWLDEALTQYTTVQYYEYRYGPERRSEIISELFTPFYWQLRNTHTDRPIIGSAAGFSEALYYPVLYGKGPLFFEAVRNQLGDELYFAGLRQYARQYRYDIAAPEDLLKAWTQVGGQDMEAVYRQWIGGE
jgi:aminopeptidase N